MESSEERSGGGNSEKAVKEDVKEFIVRDDEKPSTSAAAATKEPSNAKKNSEGTQAKKEYKRAEMPVFYGYNKKKMLAHLKQYGCTRESFERSMSSFRATPALASEYLEKWGNHAQNNIHKDIDSQHLSDISKWLRLMEEKGFDKNCHYEPALMVKAIANNEEFPTPDKMGGVDLKTVYSFIGNALMGLPQVALEGANAEFLNCEIKALIDKSNMPQAQARLAEMRARRRGKKHDSAVLNTSCAKSLDPLQLTLDKADSQS